MKQCKGRVNGGPVPKQASDSPSNHAAGQNHDTTAPYPRHSRSGTFVSCCLHGRHFRSGAHWFQQHHGSVAVAFNHSTKASDLRQQKVTWPTLVTSDQKQAATNHTRDKTVLDACTACRLAS